jgi:hypothetical protein
LNEIVGVEAGNVEEGLKDKAIEEILESLN